MGLAKYNPSVRSKVPSLDEAYHCYQKTMNGKNKDEVLLQFRDVFKSNGLENDFGLILSHRHNDHDKVLV